MIARGLIAVVFALALAAPLVRSIDRATDDAWREVDRVNSEGDRLYSEAIGAIRSNDYPDHARADAALGRIDPRAACWPHARDYRAWIGADHKVREARREYNLGNCERAVALLDEVIRVKQIGAEAQETVRQRRAAWLAAPRVVATPVAAVPFMPPPVSPPAPPPESLERRFPRGVRALHDGDAATALARFRTLLDDAGDARARWQTAIGEALASREGRRWLERAHREFMMDRTRALEETQSLCKLLCEVLPETHADRRRARELLQSVRTRITSKLKSGE